MATMQELTHDFEVLWEMIDEDDGENADLIMDSLEGIDGEIEYKAEQYAIVLDEIKARIAGFDEVMNRLAQRKKAMNSIADRMKATLTNAMIVTGKMKFKQGVYSFNVQKNPESVLVEDEWAVPMTYKVEQAPKVDKKKIKEAIKAGETVPGCKLIQTQGVRIR